MFKKLASVILIATIACTIGGSTSAFATSASEAPLQDDPASVPAKAPEEKEAKANEQLKTNMLKLVADAKAGKVKLPAKSQIQPGTSNNLSKGKKIAIGVGIAVIVVAIIVVIHEKNHLFDDFRLGN
jgi:preprotein translocase subunit SecF